MRYADAWKITGVLLPLFIGRVTGATVEKIIIFAVFLSLLIFKLY